LAAGPFGSIWRGALLAGLLLAACSKTIVDPSEGPSRPHDTRTFFVTDGQPTFTALTGASAYYGIHQGIHGQAGYRIEVPDNWNGTLVMYAHGYRGTVAELRVGTPGSLREHLIERGYAWAASSYSANYYDVRAGVEDTNALALAFGDLTGRSSPNKYYIAGVSMGGHITGAAVEAATLVGARYRVAYAAALPMCGVMADNELGNYFQAYTIAARELAGVPLQSFPDATFDTRLPAIKQALWVDYDTDPNTMTSQGEKLRNVLMHLSGGPRPTFVEGFAIYQDLLFDRGSRDGTWTGILGGVALNTTDIVYQLDESTDLSAEEVAFNSGIFRIQGDLLAHNPLRPDGVRAMPIIEGRLSVPVLSMHTLENRVPFWMQQLYAERAAANGNADRLVQRVIRSPLHCDFTPDERISAFDALANWEENGVVPAGDDVLDPEVVSDPNYGCQFTSVTRTGIPTC
jgi:hypothetical protein